MLKAIVFDYNGTLVDDLSMSVESYYRAGREMGFSGLTRATILRHISQPPLAKAAAVLRRDQRRAMGAGRSTQKEDLL